VASTHSARHPEDNERITLGTPPFQTESIILFENRSLLALDKPAGWNLNPTRSPRTGRNLQVALEQTLLQRPPWVRRRNLRFLRFIHRLDTDTTGILLLVKSRGAIAPFSRLLQDRLVEKTYLAAVQGEPPAASWTCDRPLARDLAHPGRMRLARTHGLSALTRFTRVQPPRPPLPALVTAVPVTGRTHQIRLHLAAAGCPVLGDRFYGSRTASLPSSSNTYPLALRAVTVSLMDPFEHRPVHIQAPAEAFLRAFGWDPDAWHRSIL